MVKYLFLFLLASSTFVITNMAQTTQKNAGLSTINELAIQGQLEFLASDWMLGRETGTKGAYISSDYLASLFKEMGLKPGGDFAAGGQRGRRGGATVQTERPKTYFQNFPLIETLQDGDPECALVKKSGASVLTLPLQLGIDFTVATPGRSVEAEAPLVFVGYGINEPTYGYNDYARIDVRGKIVVRLAGYPGYRDPDSKAYAKFNATTPSNPAAIERNKDRWAIEAGAIGVVEVMRGFGASALRPSNIPFRYNEANYEGDEPFRTGQRIRLRRPESMGTGGLLKISLTQNLLDQLLTESHINIGLFEKTVAEKLRPSPIELDGQLLSVKSKISTKVINVRNVVGILEGKRTDECIVVGAHYDHIGEYRGFIYNGSDDNASGTVGVLSIARAMIQSGIKPEVTLVFCAWTGEEKGLIGSAYFADNPVIEKIHCYMNYDMISRVAPDDTTKTKCDYNSTSTMPLLQELAERHVKEYNLGLDVAYVSSEQPRGGSDFTSFSAKGIPIFLIHGKFTPDYHQFTDHADKADLTYMADIVRLGYLNIFELATKSW